MGNGEFPISIVLKALDKLTAPLAHMSKPFEAMQGTIQRLNNSFAAHSLKMESYTKGFKGAGEALEGAGVRMSIGVTAPIEIFRAKAISAAADFETSMNKVEAATGATGDEMKAFSDLAKEVGKTTSFSAEEAGNAMASLARQGMSAHDIIEKLPSVAHLAAAAHIELGQAADSVSEILNGYNVPAEKSSKAIDTIAKASQLTRGGLEAFGEAMAHVGPVAAGMNISLDDTTAVIAAMSRSGFVGGRAGSALARGISEIINPSETAIKALSRLKIKPTDVMDGQRNLKGLVNLLEVLQSHGAKTADLFQIFGAKGGVAFEAVLSKGTAGLRDLQSQLKNSSGAAEKLSDIQEKGLNVGLKKLGNAFKNLGIAIGESGALETFAKFITYGTVFLTWLGEMNPTLLKWGFILLGVVAAIGPLLAYVGMISMGIAALLPFLSMMAAGFASVMAVVSVMGLPILLIVGAIALLAGGAYLLYRKWEPIKAFFVDLWDTVKNKFLDTWNTIKGKIGYFIPGGLGETLSAGEPLNNVLQFPSRNASFAPPSFGDLAQNNFGGMSRNETHLLVEFENMPRGSRVTTKKAESSLDLSRGYALEQGFN